MLDMLEGMFWDVLGRVQKTINLRTSTHLDMYI